MTLIHEAEIVVSQLDATADEKRKLREFSLMGIFPYACERFPGNSLKQIEAVFKNELFMIRRIRGVR